MANTQALKDNAVKYAKLFKSRWKKPKEGYSVSYKEMTAAALGHMGHASVLDVSQYVELASTSAVISMIFGISFTDIYVIGLMGTIISYGLNGISGQVIDNLGNIPKKTLGGYATITTTLLAIVGILAFANFSFLTSLDAILSNFFIHLFIVGFFKVAGIYLQIIIYKLFGKKWGKFKPWLVLMGLPVVVVSSIITFLPTENLTYNNLLIAVTALTSLLGLVRLSYTSSDLSRLQVLMTTNRQERIIMNSIYPVIGGLFTSFLGIFLSPLATLLGYEVNSIEIYRIVVPIFGLISLIPTSLLLLCHERVNVAKNHVTQISFKQGFVSVIKNKYLWIIKMSTAFAVISTFSLMAMQWTLLYGTKMQWLSGILATICMLPATPANLLTPFISKKLSNRQIMLIFKGIQTLAILSCILSIRIQNDAIAITLVVLASMICTFCSKPASIVTKSCQADAWDYHQWKYGERMEGASGYFGYITTPITIVLGYLTPLCYERVGFIGDYDIMYDTEMRYKVLTVHIVLYAFEIFMCGVPYIFYDLTPKKMQGMLADLEERKKAEEALELEGAPPDVAQLSLAITATEAAAVEEQASIMKYSYDEADDENN